MSPRVLGGIVGLLLGASFLLGATEGPTPEAIAVLLVVGLLTGGLIGALR